MQIQKHIPLVTLAAGLVVTVASSTFSQSSVVRWHSLSGGLGMSSGDNSRVVAVLGQPLAGHSMLANSILKTGFLVHPSASGSVLSVDEGDPMPTTFELHQNYPNPFNPGTSITFHIASASHVWLKVFDVLGREVATVVDELKSPGTYEVLWKASGLSSGVYFYRLQTSQSVQTRRMILLK